MRMPGLIVLIEIHAPGRRGQVASGSGRQRESVHRIQPHCRSILAEENRCVAR
jgi:hypothetical protein